jgi:hypothetical protein
VSCWRDCVGHLVVPSSPSWEGDSWSNGCACRGEAVDPVYESLRWLYGLEVDAAATF